jgi:hypothetical protein
VAGSLWRVKKTSVRFFGGVGLVEAKTFLHAWEGVELSAIQNDGIVAVGADEVRLMRYNNHGPVTAFLKKLVLTPGLKSIITNGNNLVNQITVEFDAHGEGEGEAGAHAGGIGFDLFVKVSTEFGKVLDKRDLVFERSIINPADEAKVIQTGERALKTTSKCERPRYLHTTMHRATGGSLGTANDANQCGFAGAIPTKHANFLTWTDAEVDVVENRALSSMHSVALGDVAQLNHEKIMRNGNISILVLAHSG